MKLFQTVSIAAVLIFPAGIAAAQGVAAVQDVAPMALNSYSSAPQGINTAIVIDQRGTTLGIVQKIETSSTGNPTKVDVMMPGGRQLVVDANAASYDALSHRVIADQGVIQTAETVRQPRG
jgi:hypothetical protein